jgi:hypothetical protein
MTVGKLRMVIEELLCEKAKKTHIRFHAKLDCVIHLRSLQWLMRFREKAFWYWSNAQFSFHNFVFVA